MLLELSRHQLPLCTTLSDLCICLHSGITPPAFPLVSTAVKDPKRKKTAPTRQTQEECAKMHRVYTVCHVERTERIKQNQTDKGCKDV